MLSLSFAGAKAVTAPPGPESVSIAPTSFSGGVVLPTFTFVRDFTLTFDFSTVSDDEVIESADLLIPTTYSTGGAGTAEVTLFREVNGVNEEFGSTTAAREGINDLIDIEILDLTTLNEARSAGSLTLTIVSNLIFVIPTGVSVEDYFMSNSLLRVNYFVSGPPTAAPLPGTLLLGLGGVAAFGALGLRRRRRAVS